jgi:hypothetical protein
MERKQFIVNSESEFNDDSDVVVTFFSEKGDVMAHIT